MSMHRSGITLFEILIAIALIVVLTGAILVFANPLQLIAGARNSQRNSHITAVANAIRQNIADTRTGAFTCTSGEIPTSSRKMASGAGNYDIAPCLVPTYLRVLPIDPSGTSSRFNSISDYDTNYWVMKNASTGEVTVTAPLAELGKTISITE